MSAIERAIAAIEAELKALDDRMVGEEWDDASSAYRDGLDKALALIRNQS
jgi:hypothetical protein